MSRLLRVSWRERLWMRRGLVPCQWLASADGLNHKVGHTQARHRPKSSPVGYLQV
jgi:hypothetical protein